MQQSEAFGQPNSYQLQCLSKIGKIFTRTCPMLNFRIRFRVRSKVRHMIRFRVRVRVKDMARVGIIFSVRLQFALSIQ